MPGFVFIAGVNVTDKNVREIVFRGTPAEVAYVVAVSLMIHTLALAIPYGPGGLIDEFAQWTADVASPASTQTLPQPAATQHLWSHLILLALGYVILSSIGGGLLGLGLGKVVASGRFPLITKYFVKHRWMIELLTTREGRAVFAQVITSQKYEAVEKAGDSAIMVEGTVRDCFFGADGALLYLAFSSFQIRLISITNITEVSSADGTSVVTDAAVSGQGRLLLEGRNVLLARYETIPTAAVSGESARRRIAQELGDDPDGPAVISARGTS
jgi:hypothetical protein